MRDEHIITILEGAPFSALCEKELTTIRAHVERCGECLRAYEAARVASLLLTERAGSEFEPPPFFQTRVLAAMRERRAAEEVPALSRLWRAAGALASSMAVTVAALFALTFTVPDASQTQEVPDTVAASDLDTDDAMLLAQEDTATDEEVDYNQVLTTIYETEGAGGIDGQDR